MMEIDGIEMVGHIIEIAGNSKLLPKIFLQNF